MTSNTYVVKNTRYEYFFVKVKLVCRILLEVKSNNYVNWETTVKSAWDEPVSYYHVPLSCTCSIVI